MTESQDQASAAALSAMKLPQLQAIANQIGLKGTSRLRKGELIDAIKAHNAESQAGKGRQQSAPKQHQPRNDRQGGEQKERTEESRNRPARQKDQRNRGRQQQVRDQSGESLDVLAEFESDSSKDSSKVARLDDIQLPAAEEEEASDPQARRRRARDRRDRNKRRPNQRDSQNYDDVEVVDGDDLIPIAGVLDVLDNYAFVRTTGYLPGSSDVYVNLGMVRRYSLRRGDAITGAVKPPREGETSNRQKFNALVAPEQVNNAPAAEAQERPEFDTLPAVFPQKFISLGSDTINQKTVDVLAPIALGSRVLISAEPEADRLGFLTDVAQGIAANQPHAHLMVVLIDERPEDATHMQRNVHGEVIASSFDRSGNDHTTVAGLAIERAKRLVELGQDVIVVFDSVTALGRAYHTSTNPSQRVLEHGWDAGNLHSVKQLFGAGRKIENGGSLTLVATGVRDTAANEFILAELSAVANINISLVPSETGAVVNPEQTATRDLPAVFDVDDIAPRIVLRRLLGEKENAAQWLNEQLEETSAADFLARSVKVTPREKAEIRRSLA